MKAVLFALLAAGSPLGAAAGPHCPDSPAWVHASCEVVAKADQDCDSVIEEVKARVAGQPASWHDPHNKGTYSILSSTGSEIDLQRVTANGQYTDKLNLVFTASTAQAGCTIEGCSESQVTSVFDFSTNYCNLRMLYCGSADGCKPVKNDITSTETSVSPSVGAGSDMSACLVAAEVAAPNDGQCTSLSYQFCCATGVPCDCSKAVSAPNQCQQQAYTFCCAFGTPCNCSNPPPSSALPFLNASSTASLPSSPPVSLPPVAAAVSRALPIAVEVGQCAKAPFAFCCGLGTVCDCSKPSTAPDQCSNESYTFCCEYGTPCNCSQPPSSSTASLPSSPSALLLPQEISV